MALTSLNGPDPCKCRILLMAVITADGQRGREREGGREGRGGAGKQAGILWLLVVLQVQRINES